MRLVAAVAAAVLTLWPAPAGELVPAPSGADWPVIVAVLTQPDVGPAGRTMRWAGPQVTYRLELPGYPADYQDEARQAFAWAAAHSGLDVVEVAGPADIVVHRGPGNGAVTRVWPDWSGRLTRARIRLGCCRPRAAWEDILQSFGPMGDRSPDGLFSQDLTAERPGPFEAEVYQTLYRNPPGTAASDLR